MQPSARVAQAQYGRIGKPYLIRYATNDALDADAIARADAGPGGELAHIFVRMFRGFRPGEKINPLLDTNKDGRISFTEADPILASWYADDADSGERLIGEVTTSWPSWMITHWGSLGGSAASQALDRGDGSRSSPEASSSESSSPRSARAVVAAP